MHPWFGVPPPPSGERGECYDSTLQNPQILSLQIASFPSPWVQSAIQSVGRGDGSFLGTPPPDSAPGRKGRDPRALESLPLQSYGARRADEVQYWGAGAPDPPGAPGLAWDFMCWTLARIFFWCPARVTPIRSRSLGKNEQLGETTKLPGHLSFKNPSLPQACQPIRMASREAGRRQ